MLFQCKEILLLNKISQYLTNSNHLETLSQAAFAIVSQLVYVVLYICCNIVLKIAKVKSIRKAESSRQYLNTTMLHSLCNYECEIR